MRIPENIIDDIRNASEVVHVIGSYVKLKKTGSNFVGLCPFHNEKTPSFSVSPSKQIWRCFGCSRSGNVFTFIMEYEKLNFGPLRILNQFWLSCYSKQPPHASNTITACCPTSVRWGFKSMQSTRLNITVMFMIFGRGR